MKIFNILIVLILLISVASCQNPLKVAQKNINWTQNVGSQIHGVTNGTAAQDVVTFSQSIALIRDTKTLYVGNFAGADYRTDGGIEGQVQINAAIDAAGTTGGEVVIVGVIGTNGPVLMDQNNVALRGLSDSWSRDLLGICDTDADGINVTGYGCSIKNLYMVNGTAYTPTAGYFINVSGDSCVVDNVMIYNPYNGIRIDGSLGSIRHVQVRNVLHHGIEATGTNIINIQDAVVIAHATVPVYGVGLYLHDIGECINVDNVDIMGAWCSLYIDDVVTGKFSNSYFDQGKDPNTITGDTRDCIFTNCYITTLAGAGINGLLITGSGVWNIGIFDSTFLNCGAAGIKLDGGCNYVKVSGCTFYNMGTVVPSYTMSVDHGHHYSMTGCSAIDGPGTLLGWIYTDHTDANANWGTLALCDSPDIATPTTLYVTNETVYGNLGT